MNLAHVERGSRQGKETRCKGRRRNAKGQGKVLPKVRQGKEEQNKSRGVNRVNQ